MKFFPDVITSAEAENAFYVRRWVYHRMSEKLGRHINKSVLLNEIQGEMLGRIVYYKQFMSLKDTDPLVK